MRRHVGSSFLWACLVFATLAVTSGRALTAFGPPPSDHPMFDWTTQHSGQASQLSDVNGDGLPDVFMSFSDDASSPETFSETWINTGSSWVKGDSDTSTATSSRVFNISMAGQEPGARLVLEADSSGADVEAVLRAAFQLPKSLTAIGVRRAADGAHIPLHALWRHAGEPMEVVATSVITTTASPPLSTPPTTSPCPVKLQGWHSSFPFELPPVAPTGTVNAGMPPSQFLDVNGDGLPDVVVSCSGADNSAGQFVFMNTGAGWVESSSWTPPRS